MKRKKEKKKKKKGGVLLEQAILPQSTLRTHVMLCSISGVVPDEAVVNTKTGFVYERRLITKHLESTGTDPHTGEALGLSDLLPLRGATAARPRPLAAMGVHGLLGAL